METAPLEIFFDAFLESSSAELSSESPQPEDRPDLLELSLQNFIKKMFPKEEFESLPTKARHLSLFSATLNDRI